MSKYDMTTRDALELLGISIRTLNRYVKEKKIVPKKKKDNWNYFKKSDLMMIASEIENNKQYSSTKNKPPITPEVLPADALVVTDNAALDVYNALREQFFPHGTTPADNSLLNDLAVVRLHSNKLVSEIVANPLDEYIQKMLDRSLNIETKLIARIKHASVSE